MLDATDRKLINSLQGGFPISETPYKDIGRSLGLDEQEVIQRLGSMLDAGTLSRFGPMYNAECMGGAFCLCAMSVPDERLEEVIEKVNERREVAHNYERAHDLNLWFVLATENEEDIKRAARDIEQVTSIKVHLFPKLKEFFVKFEVRV